MVSWQKSLEQCIVEQHHLLGGARPDKYLGGNESPEKETPKSMMLMSQSFITAQ